MELDPTNNYRRALELRRPGDFTAAIADVCLCSKPSPGLAMIAWEALAETSS
jgi:hypothetical protein